MNHQEVDDTLHPLEFVSGIFGNGVFPVKVLAEVARRIPGAFEPSLTETQLVINGGVIHNDYLPAKAFPIREGSLYLVTQADFPVEEGSEISPGQFPRLPGPSKVTHRYVFVGPDENRPYGTFNFYDKEIYVSQIATIRPPTTEERRQGARPLVLDQRFLGNNYFNASTIPAMGVAYLPGYL